MPLVYGYCRASTSKQVDSTETQMQLIKNWFDGIVLQWEKSDPKTRGAKPEWGDFLVDKATSGRVPFAERTYGGLLNSRLQRGDTVIVTKLDRMFRNSRDGLNVVHDFEQREITLILTDLSISTASPIGKFFFTMVAAFAEFERCRISERTREALAIRKTQGRPIARQPPYGWKISHPRTKHGIKKFAPDYEAMTYGFAVMMLRDRYKVPVEAIALASHVVKGKEVQTCDVNLWEKAARNGYIRHDGKDPLKLPETRASVMKESEAVMLKILTEVFRRKGFWAKRHLDLLPCLSTTSP